MKPMVVSAAAAERTPRADPSVSAALPCRRCRREIFPKSMDRSFGGHAAAEFAAAPIRRRSELEDALGCLGALWSEQPGGHWETARCAVGHLDLVFPRQAECAGHHVLHEGIGTIHRAALHCNVTAVPELIDVVFDAPVNPCFAHKIGTDLGGDDFVGTSCRAMGNDAAVEIHDHAFAHGIE